jgi:hypothetical protein
MLYESKTVHHAWSLKPLCGLHKHFGQVWQKCYLALATSPNSAQSLDTKNNDADLLIFKILKNVIHINMLRKIRKAFRYRHKYLFIYLLPTDRSSPITGGLHKVIQNMHSLWKKKNKRITYFSILYIWSNTHCNKVKSRHNVSTGLGD